MNEPTAPAMKYCPTMGHIGANPLPASEFNRNRKKRDGLQARCRDCERRHREANAEKAQATKARYREANREAVRAKGRIYARQYIADHPEQIRERNRRDNENAKIAVYDHYGHECACCGTTEDLTIDHIDGGGSEHRLLTGWGTTFYHWLIKNGFPAGYQVLCRPCNGSKWTGDRCRLDHVTL